MARKLIIIFLLLFLSCKENKDKLELTILNKELVAFQYGSHKDTINIIKYCIENKSNNKYYICNMPEFENNGLESNKNLYKNGFYFNIYDSSTKKEIEYNKIIVSNFFNEFKVKRNPYDSICSVNYLKIKNKEYERMGYVDNYSYFMTNEFRQSNFIYPNEKIYGQLYINLTDTMRYEDARIGFAKIYSKNKYYTKISLPSDSVNYKKKLPKHILQRIEENNFKIYHGFIECKNKVAVKVIE
ncbi:Hypothetical protein KQS_01745 [Flavobacterium indicum GPTSA100-9 = DSM 17447]|uniref:Lipoprotein n=1 Tax=Flavobacterium indicum (strain DSM 17447 / CIP 109464 / GPTSA100-9) TaxID=1094466 RepID=H8XQ47_FLAIG|nr:hypothetical protein [Flavobacterium indicum]CCG52341.1 Hypothetical protein KQS_01745 [Flavobacterium indicum GPTSA100-9 = DSM 17447]